jgi:hypothetical protein
MVTQARAIGARAPDYCVWVSQRHWRTPTAAYIKSLRMPFLQVEHSFFDLIDECLTEARQIWTLLEMSVAKGPLVFGHWFEYTPTKWASRTL